MTAYQLPLGSTGAVAPVTLRDYQEAAVQAVREAFRDVRRVLYVLPTGGGKTVTFSYIVHQASTRGKRVYIVAHRIEIIQQISAALARQGVGHGIVSPDYPHTDDPVQVCMIQTLTNRLGKMAAPDLLVVDEAHHIVSESYQKITQAWGSALHLGVTATPERLDGRGLRSCFDQMVIGPTPKELIARGALADFTYLAPPNNLDLSGVQVRGGDYAVDELAQAMVKSQIVGDAVKHYATYLGSVGPSGRSEGQPAIAFCVNVWHAEQVAERFRDAGWRSASIDGRMGQRERAAILRALAEGRLDVLTSCNLVSEGFDLPAVAGAILLRPTKSLALYLQQVGRSLRPKVGGGKAIILDHVGNCLVHGLPDWDRQWSLDGKVVRPKAAPVAVCSLCFMTLPAPVLKSDVADCEGVTDKETGEIWPCPYLEEKKLPPRELPEVEGELTDARAAMPGPNVNPERSGWAAGIDMATAKGRDWFRLLDLAEDDLDRLKEIAKARGYKRGWAQYKAEEWVNSQAEIDDFVAGLSEACELSEVALWRATRSTSVPESIRQQCRAQLNYRKSRAA